jgi:hypothetical protein
MHSTVSRGVSGRFGVMLVALCVWVEERTDEVASEASLPLCLWTPSGLLQDAHVRSSSTASTMLLIAAWTPLPSVSSMKMSGATSGCAGSWEMSKKWTTYGLLLLAARWRISVETVTLDFKQMTLLA